VALFPIAPWTATAAVASESQSRFVKALIDRVETDARFESLRGRVAALKQCQAALDKTLVEREALRTPELRATADLQAALESGRRAYNKLYPRLSLLFESKNFIETFFVQLQKSDKSDVETSEEQPAAAEA
jgi:hypothetical protein